MFERVLLPLDGSELAETAIPYVRDLAGQLGAEVYLLHACPLEHQASHHMHQIYLDNISENLKLWIKENYHPRQEPKIQAEVMLGDPIAVIFDYVKQKSIGFVALTSHGTSGLREWAMGSVADKVVRGVDIPTLLIRVKSGKILADKLRAGETADNSGMTTGFLGTRPLLPVLSSVGEHDLAVRHFQSRKFPSWGYEVDQGATTIWERWNSYTKEKDFGGEQNASMNSFAHYAFGAVGEWMFTQLAGIDTDGPGYQRIIIRPSPPTPGSNPAREPINWVKARYDSIHGRIVSNWRLKDGRFELETTIPANTAATVYLPTRTAEVITEAGRRLARVSSAKLLRHEDDRVVLAVESGSYKFACPFDR